jgi:hypothetical protein
MSPTEDAPHQTGQYVWHPAPVDFSAPLGWVASVVGASHDKRPERGSRESFAKTLDSDKVIEADSPGPL